MRKSPIPVEDVATNSIGVSESRNQILDVAEGLFADEGYSAVGMRRVAATVGLSKSTLFHHFPTKRALYVDVLDRALAHVEEALGDEVLGGDGEGDPTVGLDRWLSSVVGALSESRSAARLLMRTLVDAEPFPASFLGEGGRESMAFEARLRRVIDRLRVLLEEGIVQGAFRPIATREAIHFVMGVVSFHFASGDLGAELLGKPTHSDSEVARRRPEVVEFIRRGLSV